MCNAISYGRLGLVRLPIRTESQKMMVFEGGEFFDGETFGSTERLIALPRPQYQTFVKISSISGARSIQTCYRRSGHRPAGATTGYIWPPRRIGAALRRCWTSWV